MSRNLRLSGINYREWDEESMREFASRLSTLNRDNWNFRLATCAERIDLSEYGIEHNRCIVFMAFKVARFRLRYMRLPGITNATRLQI